MNKTRFHSGEECNSATALLEAARHDHDPGLFERATVRRALAIRISQLEMGSPPRSAGALSRVGPQLKLWLIGGCVSVATFAALGAFVATRQTAKAPAPSERAEELSGPVAAPAHDVAPEPLTAVEARKSSEVAPGPWRTKAAPRAAPRARAASNAPALRITPSEVTTSTENWGPKRDREGAPPGRVPAQSPKHDREDAPPALPLAPSQPTPAPQSNSAPARVAKQPDPERDRTRVSELAWMQRVQAALRSGDPQLALALSEEHAQLWPRGRFQQEREGVRAFVTCQLHMSEGKARASAFLSRYPESALVPRVRNACQLNAVTP